jgi:hypothetical protein
MFEDGTTADHLTNARADDLTIWAPREPAMLSLQLPFDMLRPHRGNSKRKIIAEEP